MAFKEQNLMKISKLSNLSGVNRSSIHHYLNMGLLPKPVTAGLNVHLYDRNHLAALKEIKRLREKENLPLTEIKNRLEALDKDDIEDERPTRESENPDVSSAARDLRKGSGEKKAQILEAATDMFSRIGYENVRISDITDALRMSKATFYEYFQGKEQLFIECIERLVIEIVPRDGWRAIGREEDYFKRQELRARQFLNSFPGYAGILQQARIFSRVDNPEMASKAKETFHIMTRPVKKDIEKAHSKGGIRAFDSEIGAHMLLGMVEGLGWKMMVDSSIDIDKILHSVIDLLKYGLMPREKTDRAGYLNSILMAEITDIKGVETTISQPTFGGSEYLEAQAGEASIKIDPRQTKSLSVNHVNPDCVGLTVLSSNDQVLTAEVPSKLPIIGQTPFGEFRISIEKVAKVKLAIQDA